MSATSRIIAIGSNGEPATDQADTATETAGLMSDETTETFSDPEPEPQLRGGWAPMGLALAAAAGWSAFFLWANPEILSLVTPQQGIALLSNWAVPVLLIGMGWLVATRSSRREAVRFGDVAQSLARESALLEQRLTAVNRELSLAREFLAAQSRDLESLGRTAGKRLSQHAEHLQSLVQTNGDQVNAIASVSTTALDNMEKLRDHLPVIANSAKDVANNVGNAGRVAHAQLRELIEGFNRLNEFGKASEGHVEQVRLQIEDAVTFLGSQLDHLRDQTEARFADLHARTDAFRNQFDANEDAALAAIRTRSAALVAEIDATRSLLDTHEAESLNALRNRLEGLRDEVIATSETLRIGENGAMEALSQSVARFDEGVRETVRKLELLDQQALEAARSRIATLAQEAEAFDARLAERNRAFASETEQRTEAAQAAHVAQIEQINALIAGIDQRIVEAHTAHQDAIARVADRSSDIAAEVEQSGNRMAAIAVQAGTTQAELASSLQALNSNIADSGQRLEETSTAVAHLTDDSVRLLELLAASSQQGREQLPEAMAAAIAGLTDFERRVGELRDNLSQAGETSDGLASTISSSRSTLIEALGEMQSMQSDLGAEGARYAALLSNLEQVLESLDTKSARIAEHSRAELADALDKLSASAMETIARIEWSGTEAVNALTEKLTDQAAEMVERLLREKTEESVGVLEQAASNAAGVSRDTALHLRNQLAKIAELTVNLERRVGQARERAEDQVDNDFARRVALITESLNSNGIDIAKALSTEITDTAWAAYLRGDRGIFTRRAVRLISSHEARSIVRTYGEDPEFREHVSRYIHDFEAMLRQLLATRDGNALSVTLLSSDMGKLYVALAQAIERLRT